MAYTSKHSIPCKHANRSFLHHWLRCSNGEYWWDGTAGSYSDWFKDLHDGSPFRRPSVCYYHPDPQNNVNMVTKGITTNPRIIWEGFTSSAHVAMMQSNCQIMSHWEVYKQIIRETAMSVVSIWKNSDGKHGWTSGQVQPFHIFSKEKMLNDGLEIAQLSPNIMVKVPASKEGIEVIEELAARRISLNVTLSYTLSQFIAAKQAIQRGAQRQNPELSTRPWRVVVTDMIGRFGEALQVHAGIMNVHLSTQDLRWAELAILKKAYCFFKADPTFNGKILLSSLRVDDDLGACWHLQKTFGSDLVYTLNPSFLSKLSKHNMQLDRVENCSDKSLETLDIPKDVLDHLLLLPFFREGYDETGMTNEQFNLHWTLLDTLKEVQTAYWKFVQSIHRHNTQLSLTNASDSTNMGVDAPVTDCSKMNLQNERTE